jgi:membrane-associated PAP2 superfamily phosphatase
VRVCQAKGWAGPVFDAGHANSGRVLWAVFNGGFEQRERLARERLAVMVGYY